MHLPLASAALAAAFVLAPTLASTTPASAQDFSITNQAAPPPSVAGHRGLMRQLQAWWDVHASYPPSASAADEQGTVKIHMVVRPDGSIYPVDVTQGSGSCAIDTAGTALFRGAYIRPFPSNEAQEPVALDLSLHYVLTHRHDQATPASYAAESSRAAFTISNDPVKSTVVNNLLQRYCTGTLVSQGLRNHPVYGSRNTVAVTFFRKPDGSPMAKVEEEGLTAYSPVTEEGQVLHFMGTPYRYDRGAVNWMRFSVWPDGENHLIGDTTFGQISPGIVDLSCSSEPGPTVASSSWAEVPKFQSGVAIPLATTCRK